MNQYTVTFSYLLMNGKRVMGFRVVDAVTREDAIQAIECLYCQAEILSVRHNVVKLLTVTEQL